MRARTVAIIGFFAAAGLLGVSYVRAQGPLALVPAIDARHPGVPWASTAQLARWLQEDGAVVLLDAREADEFATSHLAGARRVDPGATTFSFLSPSDRDARIVVYCSVGYRSAAVAERLRAAGSRRVFNLAGGLFQWANEGRPLADGRRRVHPYDAEWGALLDPERRAEL
ncbi:MAG: rhodanese-like domain-containing protein [Myxococcota bacterium]